MIMAAVTVRGDDLINGRMGRGLKGVVKASDLLVCPSRMGLKVQSIVLGLVSVFSTDCGV